MNFPANFIQPTPFLFSNIDGLIDFIKNKELKAYAKKNEFELTMIVTQHIRAFRDLRSWNDGYNKGSQLGHQLAVFFNRNTKNIFKIMFCISQVQRGLLSLIKAGKA